MRPAIISSTRIKGSVRPPVRRCPCVTRSRGSAVATSYTNTSMKAESKIAIASNLHRNNSQRFSSVALSNNSSDSHDQTTPAVKQQSFLPVDFETASQIDGEESQVLTIELRPGQGVRAEAGAMVFMTDSIQMETQLLSGAMSRFLTGQSVFLTDYVCREQPGTVCLGTDFYSKILRINLQEYGGNLVCQRGAFLAGNSDIGIEMEFTKSLTAGFFGGQGFILQRLTGEGDVFVKAGGALVVKDLDEGESLRVSSGSIVAFERGIDYDVQMMKGIKNAMFGGEGLFVTTLKGPGRVWLQGMPPDRMISEIARRVPPGMGLGIPIGMGGGGSTSGEEGAGDETGNEDLVASTDSVAATDAAVEADRQATVASSGMMGSDSVEADSPDALFGDAAPDAKDEMPGMDDASFASESSDSEFANESFSNFSQEQTFDDGNFANDDFEESVNDFSDGELFDDSTSASVVDAASDEGGSGILSTLWDMFMGDD